MKRALLLAAVVLVGSAQAVPSTLEQSVDKVVRTLAMQSRIIAEFTTMTTELLDLHDPAANSIIDHHLDNVQAMLRQVQRVAREK
jgi:N-acetylglucosamine kinase-like BadF-type ATPase